MFLCLLYSCLSVGEIFTRTSNPLKYASNCVPFQTEDYSYRTELLQILSFKSSSLCN